jgi:nicotinamidase-related amidase
VRYGLFDADSRELDEAGSALAFRPRVAPLVPKLESLYRLAEELALPLIFTTCCSGRMVPPGRLRGVLHVPLDADDAQWQQRVREFRTFYVAKKAYGDPKINGACRAFDMFQDNGNVARLLRMLPVDEWVVFGNGFDLCVGSAARGILAAGAKVLLLEDVRVSSAQGTPQSEAQTIAALRLAGARVTTLAQFVERLR